MAGFFSKLFGAKSKHGGSAEEVVQTAIDGMIDRAGFELAYEISTSVEESVEQIRVNFTGADAELLTSREGAVLDGLQTFLKRVLQNKFSEKRVEVVVDCDGFLESSAKELQDIAERLKTVALKKGQPSFMRALPPRDRKVIHRYLAEDDRVKSQSVGEGFTKKIKITPVKTKVPDHQPEL